MTAKIDCCLPVKNTHGSLKPVTVHNSHDLCSPGPGSDWHDSAWPRMTPRRDSADRALTPGSAQARSGQGEADRSQEPLNISMSWFVIVKKCQNLPLSIFGSWRESAQNLKLFSSQMWIHNEGSLVDVARSESSGLSWTQRKRVKESRTRSGEATSYIYWSPARKIPLSSELRALSAGDSDSEPGCGAFSDTWSQAVRPRGGRSPE